MHVAKTILGRSGNSPRNEKVIYNSVHMYYLYNWVESLTGKIFCFMFKIELIFALLWKSY